MDRVYLIATNLLKAKTTINGNVEDSLLLNSIWEAQTLNVQQTIGTKLLNKIFELVKYGLINDPANINYKNLLIDYIQDVVVYWAWLYSIPYTSFKLTNKGQQNQYSDNSQHSSLDEIKYLEQSLRDKAEFYTKRLSQYLIENYKLYPEYKCNGCGKLSPSDDVYFSGIQFDN